MMVVLSHRLHFAAGSDKNIKLTIKNDLEMLKPTSNRTSIVGCSYRGGLSRILKRSDFKRSIDALTSEDSACHH